MSSSRGFALLITVTLLAFLVLLLVSIATLPRVETQVASNGQNLVQARQIALTATLECSHPERRRGGTGHL